MEVEGIVTRTQQVIAELVGQIQRLKARNAVLERVREHYAADESWTATREGEADVHRIYGGLRGCHDGRKVALDAGPAEIMHVPV